MVDLTGIDLHNGILPSHMGKDIWEEYARVVLNWLDSGKYSGLTLADKPDLMDVIGDLGVEFTWSLPEESKEIDVLYARLRAEENPKRRSRVEERLAQLGAKVDKYSCLHPTGHDDFLLIHESHRAKLELLNKGGYKPFNHNHLFIMSDILADEAMLKAALIEFEQVSDNFDNSFEQIIVAVPGYAYMFNLADHSPCVTELASSIQYDLAMTARNNVLNAEIAHVAK